MFCIDRLNELKEFFLLFSENIIIKLDLNEK